MRNNRTRARNLRRQVTKLRDALFTRGTAYTLINFGKCASRLS